MMLTPPQAVEGDVLVSTTVLEDDHAVWSAATTYAEGDRGRVNATHTVYQSLVAGNLNHNPTTDTEVEFWIAVGPTNPYRMFDEAVQSQSTAPDMIEVVLAPEGIIDNLYLFNIDAAEARIQVEDDVEGVIYDQTFDLVSDVGIEDLYDYFFAPPRRMRDLPVEGLKPYADATITVTLSAPGETVGCGGLKIGQGIDLGLTQWGMQLGIRDYSKRNESEFGDITVTERAWSRWGKFNIWVEPGQTDAIIDYLAEFRATAVVWSGDPRYGASVIYGFFDDLTVEVQYRLKSAASLSIKGLT